MKTSRSTSDLPVVESNSNHGEGLPVKGALPGTSTAAESNIGTGRLVVVDDDRDSADMVKWLLDREGFQVTVATDDTQLLGHDLSSFQLILLDLNLPFVGGAALAAQLRARGFSAAIVAYTGATYSRRWLERAGFTDYLSKDSPIRDLIAVCQRYTSLPQAIPDSSALTRFDSPRRQEMQRAYVQGLFDSIGLLRLSSASGHYANAAALAHKMAGTGGLYDLPEISELSRLIGDALHRKQSPIELGQLIDRLEHQVETAASQLGKSLGPW